MINIYIYEYINKSKAVIQPFFVRDVQSVSAKVPGSGGSTVGRRILHLVYAVCMKEIQRERESVRKKARKKWRFGEKREGSFPKGKRAVGR